MDQGSAAQFLEENRAAVPADRRFHQAAGLPQPDVGNGALETLLRLVRELQSQFALGRRLTKFTSLRQFVVTRVRDELVEELEMRRRFWQCSIRCR